MLPTRSGKARRTPDRRSRPAAREQGLDSLPMLWERYDLVVCRLEYFEQPLQRLFALARTHLFREHVKSLGGYDVASLGQCARSA